MDAQAYLRLCSNRTCQICTTDPAVRFCQCSNPPILLCSVCSAKHQENNPLSPHPMMPISALNQDPAEYMRHYNNVSKGKMQLRSSVAVVGQFCEEMSTSIDLMISYLGDWKSSLQQWGMNEAAGLSALVESAVQEAEICLAEGTVPVSTLALALWNLPVEQLPVTSYSITPVDFAKLSQEWCQFDAQIPQFCDKSALIQRCENCKTANAQKDRLCDNCYESQKKLKNEVSFWACRWCKWGSNEKTRKVCAKCNRLQMSPEKGLESELDALDLSAEPERIPSAAEKQKTGNTWRCERCKVDVESSRGYCRKCYTKPSSPFEGRPKILSEREDLAGYGIEEGKGEEKDRAIGVDVRVNSSKIEDLWVCPACHAHNYPIDKVCYGCMKPRSESRPQSALPAREPEPKLKTISSCKGLNATDETKWTCENCSARNEVRAAYCAKCLRKKPAEVQPPSRGGDLSTDWTCKRCTLVNKESDQVCRACETKRKDLPPPSPPSREKPRTGNTWKCEVCKVDVEGRYCNSCYRRKPTPDLERKDPSDSKDWACSDCGHVNRASRSVCLICRWPRP